MRRVYQHRKILAPLALGAVLFLTSGRIAEAANVTVPIDGTYKLVFDDEFNGSSVDTSQWNLVSTTTIGGGYSNDEFEPRNAFEGGGFLSLLATQQTTGRPYLAEFIVSKQSWSYGYWEARCRVPAHGHGMWPAFWMNNGGTYPEIDIFEWIGNIPDNLALTYHPSDDATLTNGNGFSSTIQNGDYSTAFHVYGMWWQPASITWYVDGVQVFQVTQGQQMNGHTINLTSTAMQTIFTMSVGGWNNNVPDASTTWPSAFAVDYLHIYSNSPGAVAITPQAGYGGPGDSTGSGNSPPTYAPPGMTNGPATTSAVIGVPYSFAYATSGTPSASYSVTSGALPTGLTISSAGVISGTPTTAGLYTGAVTADNTLVPAATQNFGITVQDTFNTWVATNFGGQTDPTVVGPDATPENDGVPNLLKYVFDINPGRAMNSSDFAGLPVRGTATIGGFPCLTLTYRQNPLASGVSVNLRASADLFTWSTVTPDFTQSAGTDPVTNDPLVEVGVKLNGATRKFLRLSVTNP